MGKKTRRRQPTDPAEIARRNHERRITPRLWGVNEEALSQPANANVHSTQATREKVRRVRRWDVFATLRSRDSLTEAQEMAVRRLEDLLAVRHRVDRARASDERVDRSQLAPIPVTDASLDALREIDEMTTATGRHSMKVLLAILEPQVLSGQPVNWRSKVFDATGERYPHGQVALVRAACENLRLAWVDYDNRPRRAA
jgi:hypothetical protein